MKNLAIAAAVATIGLSACDMNKGGGSSFNGEIKTDKDSISYALGVTYGSSLRQSEIDSIDFSIFKAAAEAAISGDSTIIANRDAQMYVQNFARQAQEKKMMAQYADRIEENVNFLAENGKRAEVQTTASGLQYEVIEKGDGAHPTAQDVVKVHYQGTLIDGTEFDSSYKRDQPAQFALSRVIPGWTEGIQLMSVGSKYKFYIPQELAYGASDKGTIPPYSTLIFEVELLDIPQPQQ